ncbi:hypothetical protein J4Q44_G00310090 [Coregonus suidteri]|uniref:Uncharacterized protein n=1 Tax=Coregonus suidteri TaxID=861788 RepID=A0AAN8KNH7_9TELE
MMDDDATTKRSGDSHLEVMETVSLNHEEEEKEDARRNKQQHASRIPAFHKTLAKKTPYRHQQQSKLRSTCPVYYQNRVF